METKQHDSLFEHIHTEIFTYFNAKLIHQQEQSIVFEGVDKETQARLLLNPFENFIGEVSLVQVKLIDLWI